MRQPHVPSSSKPGGTEPGQVVHVERWSGAPTQKPQAWMLTVADPRIREQAAGGAGNKGGSSPGATPVPAKKRNCL